MTEKETQPHGSEVAYGDLVDNYWSQLGSFLVTQDHTADNRSSHSLSLQSESQAFKRFSLYFSPPIF